MNTSKKHNLLKEAVSGKSLLEDLAIIVLILAVSKLFAPETLLTILFIVFSVGYILIQQMPAIRLLRYRKSSKNIIWLVLFAFTIAFLVIAKLSVSIMPVEIFGILLLLFVMQVLDIITTKFLVGKHGLAAEGVPSVRKALAKNATHVWIMKLLIAPLAYILYLIVGFISSVMPFFADAQFTVIIILTAVNFLMVAVVLSNIGNVIYHYLTGGKK